MNPCKVDVKQLLRMLHIALQKENDLWTPAKYKEQTDELTEIGSEKRNETVRWLAHLSRKMQFHPETLALAVNVLDRFLDTVKAHAKYLKIIGVASLYLSAKTVEEDQAVPQTLEFIRQSECGCSVAEILRMERVILDKLNWDLRAVTSLDFMHIFHALVIGQNPNLLHSFVQMTPSRQMSLLTRKLQLCMAYHGLLDARPSTVALSVLSLELELFHKKWFAVTARLQDLIQVDSDSLMLCRENIKFYMSSIGHNSTTPTKHLAPFLPSYGSKAAKRKAKEVEESDDVYDAIKRLYNDEDEPSTLVAVTGSRATTCSSELQQDSALPASTLQAVVN